MRLLLVPLALALTVVLAAGCGADSSQSRSAGDQVVVSAAASLQPALSAYASNAGIDAKQSFAGSDALAAQIRQGVIPDVYAAANTSLPDELFKDGLVEKPIVFATNTLVLAVPDGSSINSLDDLTSPDLTIAVGDVGVPVGDYTNEVLGRLPGSEGDAILANVRSREPDVAGVVGKLTQNSVDAGFVYATDVVATKGALEAIDLPAKLQPDVAYGAAVVTGAENPDGAASFVNGLLDGDGAAALRDAGFGPPPSR